MKHGKAAELCDCCGSAGGKSDAMDCCLECACVCCDECRDDDQICFRCSERTAEASDGTPQMMYAPRVLLVPDDISIGRNVRAFRKRHKLTLQQVAEAAGLSVGYLSNLEVGRRSWNESILQAVTNVIITNRD